MNVSGDKRLWDSPCVGICSSSNLGDEVCIGCKRTKWEVDNWNRLEYKDRIEINKRLQENKASTRL